MFPTLLPLESKQTLLVCETSACKVNFRCSSTSRRTTMVFAAAAVVVVVVAVASGVSLSLSLACARLT